MTKKAEESDFRISPMLASTLWLGLCLGVAIAGFFTGVPKGLLAATTLFVATPSVMHLIIGNDAERETFEIWIVFAWIIVGLVSVLVSGGPVSPLVVMLALGPMHALSHGRFRLGIEASVFAGMGYLAISVLSMTGTQMPSITAHGVLVGLGALISVLQIGVFAAAAGAVFEDRKGQSREIERWISTLSDTPVLIVSLDGRRRVRSWVGDLRMLPGMSPDTMAQASMADIFKEPYQAIRGCRDGHAPELKMPLADGTQIDFLQTRDGYRLVLTKPNVRAALPELPVPAPVEADAVPPTLTNDSVWIASLGHELRNMLNPVSGYSDLILSERAGPVTEPYKGFARSIKQGAEHLGLLVDDLMTAAKGRSGHLKLEPELLDIVMEAEDALQLIKWQSEASDVKLTLSAPEDAVPVYADRKALRQIFLNLLSNAVKYSPPQGEVELGVSMEAGFAVIAVKDQGDGLSEDELARLGEPFFQAENARHRPGTGLGLSIVMMLADALGGSVKFDSQKGVGTTASVRVPLFVEEAAA